MRISKLTLRQFRNYRNLSLTFAPGINLISGDNGVGKTNIVEAIYYLAFATSFRTSEEVDLLYQDQPLAYIEGAFTDNTSSHKIQIELQAAGKKIARNGHGVKRLSELNDLVNVLVFTPRDVLFFDDAPRVRRRYLDTNIAKTANFYLRTLASAEKALNERNRILKQTSPDLTHLSIITEKLIQASEVIVNYRAEYLKKLQIAFNRVLEAIAPELGKITLAYLPFVSLGDGWIERAKKAYLRSQPYEIEHHGTSIGYQREDITAEYEGKAITSYASQGQKRLIAMALKIAPYFLVQEENKLPIIILDDGLSELDHAHQEAILAFLSPLNQTFITVTKLTHPAPMHYVVGPGQKVTREEKI